jgi:hypothetical protein
LSLLKAHPSFSEKIDAVSLLTTFSAVVTTSTPLEWPDHKTVFTLAPWTGRSILLLRLFHETVDILEDGS